MLFNKTRANKKGERKEMSILHNNEGMWLPGKLPLDQLEKMYGFRPTREWYEHVQKASIRMNNGGSASFVSSNGLLVTNHHVAESILNDLATEEKDYIRDGFYAEKQEDEIPAKQLEINVLWDVVDVTKRVKECVARFKNLADASKERKAEISRIETEYFKKTGLRSDVVTLYQGGAYHLYIYKKYTDVRLVFAPEMASASFGGDIDNYEFPRFCLDIAFLRVYENDRPLETKHFFKWSEKNSKEGDLLFVSGHPGSTDRLSTYARLCYLRDSGLPHQLNWLRRMEINLQQFSGRSKDNERKALHSLHGVQNIRKRFLGQLAALQDPAFISQKKNQESELRAQVNARESLAEYRDAWDMIKEAENSLKKLRDRVNLFENGMAFSTRLFSIARHVVRLTQESVKANDKRLPEYNDSNRDSLFHALFSPAPIHKDLEQHSLIDSLSYFMEVLGADNSMVRQVMGLRNPKEAAYELISGTKLDSVKERKRLVNGGKKAIEASDDSFIKLALLIDKESRKIRKVFEVEVEEIRRQAYAKITKALFLLYGSDVYPDATFTLRITFGQVLGYTDGGVTIPYSTKISGIFKYSQIHDNEGPWELPERWLKARRKLESKRSDFNFVTTHDTHGGNSGSPVFDPDLIFRGILFDGNIYDNATTFMYVDDVARSVSVHAAGITTALRNVYRTGRLLKELGVAT